MLPRSGTVGGPGGSPGGRRPIRRSRPTRKATAAVTHRTTSEDILYASRTRGYVSQSERRDARRQSRYCSPVMLDDGGLLTLAAGFSICISSSAISVSPSISGQDRSFLLNPAGRLNRRIMATRFLRQASTQAFRCSEYSSACSESIDSLFQISCHGSIGNMVPAA